MTDKKAEINPVDDHSVKFNITQERLRIANERILDLSKTRKEEKGVNVEIVGDKILHVRTEEDYKTIYVNFIEEEVEDFLEARGYGQLEIERIGIKKFIDANDWRGIEDINKWRTDAACIIPCLHCADEFAPLDMTGRLSVYGVCSKCTPLYDMGRIESIAKYESEKETYEAIEDSALRYTIARIRVTEQFVVDQDFRNELLLDKGNAQE